MTSKKCSFAHFHAMGCSNCLISVRDKWKKCVSSKQYLKIKAFKTEDKFSKEYIFMQYSKDYKFLDTEK